MSHFSVLVVLDEYTEDALAKALQPFHEYECTGTKDEYVVFVPAVESVEDMQKKHVSCLEQYPDSTKQSFEQFVADWYGYELRDGVWGRETNPNKKWDWWVIGGRYRGRLITVPQPEFAPVGGRLSTFEQIAGPRPVPGHDVAKWGDIDIAAMKRQAQKERGDWIREIETESGLDLAGVERGIKAYQAGHEVWMNTPEPRPRGAEYYAWLAANVADGDLAGKVKENQWDLPELGDLTIAEWIAAAPALTAFAILKDGKWAENGEMGWWACVSNENPNWETDAQAIIETIRPDQWVAVVDCHI